MDTTSEITSEQIRKSSLLLKQARPVYKELIDFYEEMFVAQEESKSFLNLEPVAIEQKTLKKKLGSGIALINSSQIVIDLIQSKALLMKLCNIASNKAPFFADSAKKILSGLSNKQIDFKKLFVILRNNDRKEFKSICKSLELYDDALIFLAFEAMSPSIQTCAAHLSQYLNPDISNKGYCPICGNLPQIAFINKDGEKNLICNFCMHRWKVSRIGCSLCLNKENDKQHYFFNEEEKEYRVDLCDKCKKYIKVVDLRELTRDFYPPLEQLCTIHLDMQARGEGYSSITLKKI